MIMIAVAAKKMSSRLAAASTLLVARPQLVDRPEEPLHAAGQNQDVRTQVLDHRQHVRADHHRGACARRALATTV